MRSRLRDVVIVIATAGATGAVALAIVLVAGGPSTAQAPTPFRAARLAGTDRPTLSGIWQALNTANENLEGQEARSARVVRPGVPGFPPVPDAPVLALGAIGGVPGGLSVVESGEIPYQPWAAAKRTENFENALARDPEVKCLLPGVPRATYLPYPFEIVQSIDKIMIIYGYSNAGRTIHLDDVESPGIETWMGHSVGRWEGDTLVVDVTNLIEQTWFDRAGNFHSDALHVVERFTPMSSNHLMYEATIEDAKVFTRPWKIKMPLYRRLDDHARVLDYRCVEFVEELIYGHLRKQQLVSHWEADYGRRGGIVAVDIRRKPTKLDDSQ